MYIRGRTKNVSHGLLLWFRRYNGCSDLRRNLGSTMGASGGVLSILPIVSVLCIISRCLLWSLVLQHRKYG